MSLGETQLDRFSPKSEEAMPEMDEAARRAWERIRRASLGLPTKPLREVIAESWGGTRPLSAGVLLVRWPSAEEALEASVRSDDLRLVAVARVDANGGLRLTFQTDDPDLAGRAVCFAACAPERTDKGPLAGGSVLLTPSSSDPARFEGRCWLGALQELRPGDILLIRFAVAP
jgi:hypothetical protein